MKLALLVFLTLLLCTATITDAQDYWQRINTPDSLTLTDVMVDNEGSIFLSCWNNFNKGGVYRSDDDGISWTLKNNGLLYTSILSLANDNKGTIYAGGQGRLYKSYNRGESWIIVSPETGYADNINTIRCGYDSIILAGGGLQDAILRSGDYGMTWERVLDISHPYWFESITDIQFGPNGVIYACSRIILSNDPGMVYASYDQGRTWQVFSEAGYPMALGFDNQGRLLRGEFGLGLYRYDFTTSIWEHILSNGSSPRSILTVPDGKIFLGCYYWPSYLLGGVMLSDDDGGSYQYNNSGFISGENNASELVADNVGRILVLNGWLYRSFDTIFTHSVQAIESQCISLKAFPNPFYGSINIYIQSVIEVPVPFTLQIYNSTGKLIFCSEIKIEEVYKWDGSNLPSGIYFIKVSNPNSTSTLKVLHY